MNFTFIALFVASFISILLAPQYAIFGGEFLFMVVVVCFFSNRKVIIHNFGKLLESIADEMLREVD